MHQSAQVATARNARNITMADVRQILDTELHTIYDEEIFGWGCYPHDLEFIDTNSYHETNDVDFRTIQVCVNRSCVSDSGLFTKNNGRLVFHIIQAGANRFCVSDKVLFETYDGRLVDRDDIKREERQIDYDYDVDWDDDWLFD